MNYRWLVVFVPQIAANVTKAGETGVWKGVQSSATIKLKPPRGF